MADADDEIASQEAYRPFLGVIPAEDTAVIEFPTGHVGLSVELEAHVRGWPSVCDWLAARS